MSREAWDVILLAAFLAFAVSAKLDGYLILTILSGIYLVRNAEKTNF